MPKSVGLWGVLVCVFIAANHAFAQPVNHAPDIWSVEIQPDILTVGVEPSCLYAGYTDPEGDPDKSMIQWLVNDEPVDGDSRLQANLVAGDIVKCTVTPSDGTATGSPVSVSGKVLNTPPVLASVVLAPPIAYSGQFVNCIATPEPDADGDAVRSTYRWTKNGQPAGKGAHFPGSFVRADRLVCTAKPHDGRSVGKPVTASLTAINAPPVLESAAVVSSGRNDAPLEGDTLTCVPGEVRDPDPDETFSFATTWLVDGKDPGPKTPTLDSNHFGREQSVACRIVPSDGTHSGVAVVSPEVLVRNTPPTIGRASILPKSPTVKDKLRCRGEDFYDADGDADGSVLEWKVNGQSVGTVPTLVGQFAWGDEVSCTVTPRDGTVAGEPLVARVSIRNSVPTVGKPRVLTSDGTTKAREGETLECVVSPVVDPDVGQNLSYNVQWMQGGEALSITDETLVSEHFSRGDALLCEVTPNDGLDAGKTVRSDTVQIVNTPPSIGEIVVHPEVPKAGQLITCPIVDFRDVDGDADQSRISWTLNGVAAGDGVSPGGTPVGGDTVQCSVTPFDGQESGQSRSAQATLVNTPPLVHTVFIHTQAPTTISTLEASAVTLDADRQPVAQWFAWFVDGERVVAPSEDARTLDPSHFKKGNSITVSVIPDDGEAAGPVVVSEPVTIRNSRPTAAKISVEAAKPRAGIDDLVCRVDETGSDVDDDVVAHSVQWSLEGEPFLSATETHRPNDTVPGELTKVGQGWLCEVVASDGEASSETVRVFTEPGPAPTRHTLLEALRYGMASPEFLFDRKEVGRRYQAACDEGEWLACDWEQWHPPSEMKEGGGLISMEIAAEVIGEECPDSPLGCLIFGWRLSRWAPSGQPAQIDARSSAPGEAAEGFAELCEAGDSAGCVALADLKAVGVGTELDPDGAAALWKSACEVQDMAGCHRYARSLDSTGAAAMNRFEANCKDGEVNSCVSLAHILKRQGEEGSRTSLSRAVRLFSLGCRNKHIRSCNVLSEMMAVGAGVPPSPAVAVALVRATCEVGDLEGCHKLGSYYALGTGVDAQPERAAKIFRDGCNQGWAPSCTELGGLLVTGTLLGKNPIMGGQLMARSCEKGHADACAMLGDLLVSGVLAEAVGVPEANPLELFQTACDGGSGLGCARLSATIKVRGRRGAAKRQQEEGLLMKSCDFGYGPACGELARRGMEGAWIHDQAVELLQRGCAHGDGPSCSVLGEHLLSASSSEEQEQGRAILENGCRLGHGPACFSLGQVGSDSGLAQAAKSTHWFSRACELGDGRGCDAVTPIVFAQEFDSIVREAMSSNVCQVWGQDKEEPERNRVLADVRGGEIFLRAGPLQNSVAVTYLTDKKLHSGGAKSQVGESLWSVGGGDAVGNTWLNQDQAAADAVESPWSSQKSTDEPNQANDGNAVGEGVDGQQGESWQEATPWAAQNADVWPPVEAVHLSTTGWTDYFWGDAVESGSAIPQVPDVVVPPTRPPREVWATRDRYWERQIVHRERWSDTDGPIASFPGDQASANDPSDVGMTYSRETQEVHHDSDSRCHMPDGFQGLIAEQCTEIQALLVANLLSVCD